MTDLSPILSATVAILLLSTTCLASPLELENKSHNQENSVAGEIYKSKPWLNATVPYYIVGNFDNEYVREIYAAMNEIEKYTCVKFRAYTGEEYDYILVDDRHPKCFSTLGRFNESGRQLVNLVPPCHKKGMIMHQLMHVLGIGHEHNRIDRDDYITINWENVREDRKFLLSKYVETFDVPYDYNSITHYPLNSYNKNGLPTMTLKKPGTLSRKYELSNGDIEKIKSLYKCP